MTSCPFHTLADACSHWWILRPLYKAVRLLRKLTGEEDLRRCAINALYLKPGERVLNMCCGTGENLHLLVGRDLELYAADDKQVYAEASRFEVRCNEWHNVRVFHWTDGRLPLPSASVDAILISYGLTGTDNPGCVIAECKRLLKPSGRLVVVDWVTPNNGNTILSGLLWPVHALMGCNPYTHWRRQFARAFEVCREQPAYASLMTLTLGRQRAAAAPHQPNLYELPLDPIEEPVTAKSVPSQPSVPTQEANLSAPESAPATVAAVAPETASEAEPTTTQDVAPNAEPVATQEAAPDAEPTTTPEVAPNAKPAATQEVTPDAEQALATPTASEPTQGTKAAKGKDGSPDKFKLGKRKKS